MRAYDARRAIDAVSQRRAAAERVEYRPRAAGVGEESPRPWRQRSRATLEEADEACARATRAALPPRPSTADKVARRDALAAARAAERVRAAGGAVRARAEAARGAPPATASVSATGRPPRPHTCLLYTSPSPRDRG